MAAAELAKAQRYARELVKDESRGRGDYDNAMRRLETTYGLDYWDLWSLFYRPRAAWKQAGGVAGLLNRLRAIHLHRLQRQVRTVEHELENELAVKGGDADADLESLLAEAKALLAEINVRLARGARR